MKKISYPFKQLEVETKGMNFAHLYSQNIVTTIRKLYAKLFGKTTSCISIQNGVVKEEYDAKAESDFAMANVLYTEGIRCAEDIHKEEDGYIYWHIAEKSPIIYSILKENKNALQLLKEASEKTNDMHLLVAYNMCDIHLNDLKRKKKILNEKEM